MKDGRGDHMVKQGKETKAKIDAYIAANPDALKKDVCKACNVGYVTLRKHLRSK